MEKLCINYFITLIDKNIMHSVNVSQTANKKEK